MVTRSGSPATADAAKPGQRLERLAARPGLWFALSGSTLLVVGLVGVVDLNDEADVMRREIGWYGIGGVALLGAVALIVALSTRSCSWLWISGVSCLIGVAGMMLPLWHWLHVGYSDRYWDFVTFDHTVDSPPGWWQWFVGQTLVAECLVGVAVASAFLIIGAGMLRRPEGNRSGD